ncbi:MAG: hypothetical protein ACK4X1_10920 [Terricaulis sp.]
MNRDEIDATLRSMRWGAKTANDPQRVEMIEALRAALPNTPIDDAWADFLQRVLSVAFPAAWAGVDLRKLRFAFEFATMCRKAVADWRLPDAVQEHYPRKPHSGSLGGTKDVAGAFALAQGYRGNLDAARVWAWSALKLGEQSGVPIPSLAKPVTSRDK